MAALRLGGPCILQGVAKERTPANREGHARLRRGVWQLAKDTGAIAAEAERRRIARDILRGDHGDPGCGRRAAQPRAPHAAVLLAFLALSAA